MADTIALRRFTFGDRKVSKGEDVAKLSPKVPEQQLDDFRHAGLIGPKAKRTAAPAKIEGADQQD